MKNIGCKKSYIALCLEKNPKFYRVFLIFTTPTCWGGISRHLVLMSTRTLQSMHGRSRFNPKKVLIKDLTIQPKQHHIITEHQNSCFNFIMINFQKRSAYFHCQQDIFFFCQSKMKLTQVDLFDPLLSNGQSNLSLRLNPCSVSFLALVLKKGL